MSDNSKIEFEYMCEDILNNEKFKSLNKELHHGITRYEHSMHVAKVTHAVFKTFKSKNLSDITKAALLHDFYNDNDLNDYNIVEKLKVHPDVALKNAKEQFEINSLQEDIIKNHMFPSTKKMPKTKEGFVISLIDKAVAAFEMAYYKSVMQVGVFMIFVGNILSFQN